MRTHMRTHMQTHLHAPFKIMGSSSDSLRIVHARVSGQIEFCRLELTPDDLKAAAGIVYGLRAKSVDWDLDNQEAITQLNYIIQSLLVCLSV